MASLLPNGNVFQEACTGLTSLSSLRVADCAPLRSRSGSHPVVCGSQEHGQLGLCREVPRLCQPIEEPETKMGNMKTQPTMGQKGWETASSSWNPKLRGEGQPSFPVWLPSNSGVLQKYSFLCQGAQCFEV